MRYQIITAVALVVGACSQPSEPIPPQEAEAIVEPGLYAVVRATGEYRGQRFDETPIFSAGPLPYGLDECERRVVRHQADIDEHNRNENVPIDVVANCEYHRRAPEVPNSVELNQ